MGDGQFTVPIATDDGMIVGWGRGPEPVENANFHKCIGTPLRFLRMVDGRVEQLSQEEKDALDAADQAAQEAAQQAAQAQAEADAAAAASAPFRISKRLLRQAMYDAGKAAEFRAFLAADLKRQEYYDDSQYLESNHQMVVDAMPAFASLLPEGVSVIDFLRSCEDR